MGSSPWRRRGRRLRQPSSCCARYFAWPPAWRLKPDGASAPRNRWAATPCQPRRVEPTWQLR
eukprot:3008197-Pyramimonas_sp.AAC.1